MTRSDEYCEAPFYQVFRVISQVSWASRVITHNPTSVGRLSFRWCKFEVMAGRRIKGEGTVYYDQSVKSWVGQGSAGVNPLTGKRRRVRVAARTKREAQARLRERMLEFERVSGTAAPGTVGELLDLWLKREAPKTMSLRTQAMVRSMVSNHVMPGLGQMKVGDLRVDHVESLLDAKAAEGLARSSLVKLHSFLGQAFDAGVRRRLVGWNPVRVAVVPQAPPRREGRALNASEARSLLNVTDQYRLGAWVVVALTTGLRPGEVSALHWDAIDLDRARLVVHRSLSWTNGQAELKAPKSKRPRTLSIPQRAVEALRSHRKAHLEERLLAGSRWPGRWEGLVFVTENGTPLDPANVRRSVARMAKAAGIEGVVTPYDLRHTATSILSAAGVAPELLADLLGHVDTRMVFRHYRHPVTPTIDVAAAHIERALEL